MKIIVLLLANMLSYFYVGAQQIRGVIKDENGHVVEYATVTLNNSSDSSIVKMTISSAMGQYQFSAVGVGDYYIVVTFVGYATLQSTPFPIGDTTDLQMDLLLHKAAATLNDVIVTARRRQPIEVKADRIVVNIDGMANSIGRNALELLRKAPGITVDVSGTISLAGKNEVQIFIDGKPSPLAGTDLSDFLRGLQATDISSIEIITNPSAKFEASGNGGIINIRLRKNKLFGTNGSVVTGTSFATYPKYNGSFSLNHRNTKVNIFSNYSFSKGIFAAWNTQQRETLDTTFDQSSLLKSKNQRHNFNVGLDYYLSSRSTIGVLVMGNFSNITLNSHSNTGIGASSDKSMYKFLIASNMNDASRNNVNGNLNFNFSDTSRCELRVDADWNIYQMMAGQLQPNYYFDSSRTDFLYSHTYQITSPTKISMFSAKADYEQNFFKGKMAIGGKTSHVASKNKYSELSELPGGAERKQNNNFDYRENINAIYLNYNRSSEHLHIQVGIRMENTQVSARSNSFDNTSSGNFTLDSSFSLNYTNFFPSAAFSYMPGPQLQWTLNYSYRIDRPVYRDLNPFEFKIDDYTSRRGNTGLKPQYTHSVGVTFVYDESLTTSINYSHIRDVFTLLMDTTGRSKTYISKKNLSLNDVVGVSISYPLHYKWYSLFANSNSYYTVYKAEFGAGNKIHLHAFVFSLTTDHSFKLGKGWTAEFSSFYTSPSLAQGTFKVRPLWSVDAGLQKTLLKGRAVAGISLSDVCNSMRFKGTSSYAGQRVMNWNKEETQQLRFNFIYRFGNNKMKVKHQRRTGLEEESRRTL